MPSRWRRPRRSGPRRVSALVAAALLVASSAAAHHSAAAKYDAAHPLTLIGTVAEFTWRVPHCFLYLDVASGPFAGRRYAVELSSAVVLQKAGWTRSQFAPGETLEITVLPSRAGAAAGLCRDCAIRVRGAVTKTS
ncbi:MAG TPA: DUF6152 family protein [Vicinamibacterales bacterium]|nr:DUF6152 family protein [Vicinamibacterales bacterium]